MTKKALAVLLTTALLLAVASAAYAAGDMPAAQEQDQTRTRDQVRQQLRTQAQDCLLQQARTLEQSRLRLQDGVEVEAPRDGSVTQDKGFRVQGKVQAGYQVSVRLTAGESDKEFQLAVGQDGSFATPDLNLAPGLNQVRVQVRDQNGRIVAETVRRIVAPGGDLPALSDIPGHWAEQAIVKMAAMQVVNGYDDGRFAPQDKVSGAQFLKMLAGTANLPADTTPVTGFEGIPAGDWANPYLGAAIKAGIVKGPDDPAFSGAGQATRAQMAVMLIRALGLEKEAEQAALQNQVRTQFGDGDKIPDWARGAIALAYEKGLITGMPDGTFQPDAPADRAQAVVMLLRFLNLYGTEEIVTP